MNLFSRASHTGRCKHTNEDHGWLQGFKLLAQYMTRCVTENSWSDLSWPPQTTCHIADTFERAAAEHVKEYFWSTTLLNIALLDDRACLLVWEMHMVSGWPSQHVMWYTTAPSEGHLGDIWKASGRHRKQKFLTIWCQNYSDRGWGTELHTLPFRVKIMQHAATRVCSIHNLCSVQHPEKKCSHRAWISLDSNLRPVNN